MAPHWRFFFNAERLKESCESFVQKLDLTGPRIESEPLISVTDTPSTEPVIQEIYTSKQPVTEFRAKTSLIIQIFKLTSRSIHLKALSLPCCQKLLEGK